jgi:hypothetical protein
VTAMLCIAAGSKVLHVAVVAFTLAWVHSVERTEWQEDWRINGNLLILVESRIKGSGAGMEPGEDAVLEGGWYRWRPALAVPRLVLARSDAVGDWWLCTDGDCHALVPGREGYVATVLAPCCCESDDK